LRIDFLFLRNKVDCSYLFVRLNHCTNIHGTSRFVPSVLLSLLKRKKSGFMTSRNVFVRAHPYLIFRHCKEFSGICYEYYHWLPP